MTSQDNHFWLLIALCFTPLVIQFFRKTSFFNSSISNGIILAVILSLLKWFDADPSGTVSTILFVFFLILPLYAQKKVIENILNDKYREAIRALVWLKCLCPAFPMINSHSYIVKLSEGIESISDEEALSLKPATYPALIAAVQIHFLKNDWELSAKWLSQFSDKNIEKIPWLTLLYLRILCETGKLQEAIHFTEKIKEKQNQNFYYVFHIIYLAAYSGNKKVLDKIFSLPVKDLKDENKAFWSALCLYKNEGTRQEGAELLEKLKKSENKRISKSSEAALKNDIIPNKEDCETSLNHLSFRLFDNLEDHLGPLKNTYTCTHFFLIINLILYLFTRPDLNPNFPYNNISESLILFLPESVETQQWWRLLTTTFLHGSLIHFLSNMFMLIIFGYMVEPYFNSLKLSFIYLGAGIAGMVIVTMNHSPGTLSITLGASGSTMSLMGAYIAVLLKQNSRSSVKLRRQQLAFLFILILFQSRIDLISPQISFTAHISGLVFGLISAYIFYKPLYTDLEKKCEQVSD